jgi:iron complex outermembrane receptor protein
MFATSALAQSGPVFEEVIVTAEKRSESLQDLSQAVTALTAADVEERQLTSFVDLSAIAPGVNVAKNEGFKTVITIRGIGNEANQNAIANPFCLVPPRRCLHCITLRPTDRFS